MLTEEGDGKLPQRVVESVAPFSATFPPLVLASSLIWMGLLAFLLRQQLPEDPAGPGRLGSNVAEEHIGEALILQGVLDYLVGLL